jgi:hypothetical protein
MRYLNGFFCVVLVLFAIVQYNDPDFALWIPVYAIPAAWAGVAALRPWALQDRLATLGLAACVIVAVLGTAYMWPTAPGWWRQEVWWENELAREGMGLMIVTIALLTVVASRWRAGRARVGAA